MNRHALALAACLWSAAAGAQMISPSPGASGGPGGTPGGSGGNVQYNVSGLSFGGVSGVNSNDGATLTFNNSSLNLLGSSTGYTTFASANASATNYTLTFPAATDTVGALAQPNAWTGAESHSGTEVFTSTSAAAQAAGQLQLNGIITAPTLTTTGGQGVVAVSAANGLTLQGFGSTYDAVILNKSGAIALEVLTGTQSVTINGALTLGGGITAGAGISAAAGTTLGWTGRGVFYSSAAGNINLGSIDVASPAAQTFHVQSVVAGNGNTAGVNWTIYGSLSNGSGSSGDIIIQTGANSASSGVQNSPVSALTIKGNTQNVQLNSANSWTATVASCGTLASSTGCLKLLDNNGNTVFIPVYGTL